MCLAGRLIHIVATHLPASLEAREVNLKQPPILPGRNSAAARSIANMTIAEVPDIDVDHMELPTRAELRKSAP